jgi:mannose-1-phosphate guanylyltransferase/mannose-6-phosphate isomerase
MPTSAPPTVRPVILSGGAGSRLWPLSRVSFPKQLLPIMTEQTMLQATACRVAAPDFAAPLVVTDEEYRFFVEAQLTDAGVTPCAIILEPEARNTAAAIAAAANWVTANGADDLLLILPSDHLVRDSEAFRRAVAHAAPLAVAGALVTFGIQPDRAHTGYGYIEAGSAVDESNAVFAVSRFVEKPGANVAAEFVGSGGFYWNAGIFLLRASRLLSELQAHAPAVASAVAAAMAHSTQDGAFVRPDAEMFAEAPNISVDYAVLEKTSDAVVAPVEIGWSDVGSWNAFWDVSSKDQAGNATAGDVALLDVRNSIVRSDADAVVAAIGLDEMIVVVTRDAVLVAPMARSEEVKTIVQQLEGAGHRSVSEPAQVFRPWGSYERMDCGHRFQTKRLIVKPGATLSLQKHHHRSEHWVVVTGTAEVTVGETTRLLQENESTYIPAGAVHRLANPGRVPLHLIEVQCGPYLGEDDIVRIEDCYGRTETSS